MLLIDPYSKTIYNYKKLEKIEKITKKLQKIAKNYKKSKKTFPINHRTVRPRESKITNGY